MRIGPTYNGRGLIDFNVNRRHTLDEKSLSYGKVFVLISRKRNINISALAVLWCATENKNEFSIRHFVESQHQYGALDPLPSPNK